MVKDIALTAKQKLGHTSYVHGVLTAESSLFTAVEEVRVSKNLQGLYWRNANRQWADKKVVFSHLSFLIVSKRFRNASNYRNIYRNDGLETFQI